MLASVCKQCSVCFVCMCVCVCARAEMHEDVGKLNNVQNIACRIHTTLTAYSCCGLVGSHSTLCYQCNFTSSSSNRAIKAGIRCYCKFSSEQTYAHTDKKSVTEQLHWSMFTELSQAFPMLVTFWTYQLQAIESSDGFIICSHMMSMKINISKFNSWRHRSFLSRLESCQISREECLPVPTNSNQVPHLKSSVCKIYIIEI